MEIRVKFVSKLPEINPTERTNTKRKRFVEALRRRPNTWAEYPLPIRSASSAANALKTAFPGVEAASRGGRLYARWIGEEK